MAQKFLTDIEVTRGLVDSSGDLGVAGQVLSSTGSGTNWITNESNSTVVYLDEFTGDNSTVDFTLSVSVTDENITQVYIDGVYQNKDTYSVSNTTLTFSTAPPLNADIEVITFSTATTADDLQAGVVIIPVKNTHTASIAKGEPVYITGNVGSSARLQIAPADASNSAKMPAAGLLLQTLAVNAEGYVVTGGYLRNITTDTIDGTSTSSNDTVYVKSGGGLTMTKPTGSNLIQNVAKVARSASANAGSLLVSSILRTNDVPNLTTGKIWVGDGNTVESTVVHLDESNNRLGINNNSPNYSLDVTGDANISSNVIIGGNLIATSYIQTNNNFLTKGTLKFRNNADSSWLNGFRRVSGADTLELLNISDINTNGGGAVTIGNDLIVDNELTVSGTGQSSFAGQVTIPATPSASTDAASKAYVDSQVGANNELSEVLANGNTTGGTDIEVNGDNINFADGSLARFGASNDLKLQHNGTNSFIDNETGALFIRQKADDSDIIFQNDDGSGGVIEYFRVDGGTEEVKFSKDGKFIDNVKAKFGAGSDLQIYHDGNNSYILDNGTGELRVNSDNAVRIRKHDNETMALFTANGAVELWYDNSKKFETTSAGVTVTGSITSGAITSSASVIASGNSNSFGNTTVGALTASSITSSGSLSISGNSNSIGTTTFTGNITTSGNINAGSSNYLRFTAAASGSDASVLFGNTAGTGGSLTFKRNSDAAAILTLNADTSATFSGNVTIEGGTLNLSDGSQYDSIINSGSSLTLNFDDDNNSTGEVFRINHDTTSANANNLFSITESGVSTASASFRAPIFYDTDNTGRYLDPASTSRLKHLQLYQAGDFDMYVSDNDAWIHCDARDEGTVAALYKYTRSNSTGYGVYKEYWYDGNSYQSIRQDNDQFVFSTSVSATEFDLPSGGILDWANGDARIVEGLVNNYSLSFQTYDGSSVSTALRLDGDNTATFTGTLTGGFGDFTGTNTALNTRTGTGAAIGTYSSAYAYIDLASTNSTFGSWIDFTKGNGSDIAGRIRYHNSNETFTFTTGGTNDEFVIYTTYTYSPGSSRAPVFYDSDNTAYFVNPSGVSQLNSVLRENTRISTAQEYPLGHYTGGKEIWSIDPTWTESELQEYFGNTNVSWSAQSDAPGGYAIYINGGVSVGGVYSSGFPYIPVEEDAIYYMECYIKNVGGGQRHYMGSNEYNESFSSLGGNPGSYGYWVMANTDPGTSWNKMHGIIRGNSATTTGYFENGTKYWTPMALFNYGAGSGTRACYISGWKVVKISANEYYADGTNSAPSIAFAEDKDSGMYRPGTNQLGLAVAGSRKLLVESDRVIVQNGFLESYDDVRSPLYYDRNDTTYYLDPASSNRFKGITEFRTNAGNPRGYIQATDTNDEHFIIATSGGEDIAFKDGGVSGTTNMIIRGDGDIYTYGNNYGRIWYDYDDTGYSVDPAGTTYLKHLQIDQFIYHRGDTNTRIEYTADNIKLRTGGTDRIEISSSNTELTQNWFRVSSNGVFGFGGSYQFHEINQATSNQPTLILYNQVATTATQAYGLNVIHAAHHNNTTSRFFLGQGSTSEKIKIYSNGNIQNSNNSYGQLSDINLKENIVDATPKLDDINQVRVVNFNYIGDVDEETNIPNKQIGVVAQELEQIFPGMVYECGDTETPTKSVKYSVFVPMLIKAVQELTQEVQTLKDQINGIN